MGLVAVLAVVLGAAVAEVVELHRAERLALAVVLEAAVVVAGRVLAERVGLPPL